MQIERTTTIDAPPSEVWKVLGPRFDEVATWASSVRQSKARRGTPRVSGAPMAGRTCQTELGPFRESIVEYDEARHLLAYSASGDKMPSFVHGLRNRWSLVELPGARTRVDVRLTATLTRPFRWFVTPLMKRQMGKVLSQAVEELKHYVETGKPHPRKAQSGSRDRRAA